ncbi:MAG: cytochrome P460 family protein [Gemmatimonadales bacterium]
MRLRQTALMVAVGFSVPFAACVGGETRDEASEEASASVTAAQPDTTGPGMWSYLQAIDYQSNWALWPDKGKLYKGQEPHGMLLTSYMNEAAMGALTGHAGSMPDGAIVVKENYMPDSTLAAVTVMYKRSGYNDEHNDWFFAKYLPSGELDKAPNGMTLAGRVPGCQNCHGGVRANDYIFTASLSEGG